MAIEYESIIQKMINELQHAKAEKDNHAKMKRHIAKVHVLSELVLDEGPTAEPKENITDQEIKAMLGKESTKINNQQPNKTSLGADQENEGSIFDF